MTSLKPSATKADHGRLELRQVKHKLKLAEDRLETARRRSLRRKLKAQAGSLRRRLINSLEWIIGD